MFYVNDINRENVELLAQGSRYLSDTAYEYGVQRLAADHEGERETYLYDGRGSVVQLLQGGTVSQSYSYNAYGYINADEYGIHAPFFGYNGEEQNPFTGLQYLRARYYAPQNGGFITQDSFSGILTNALSQNRYTYAENDPVNGIDPSGHAKAPGGATKGGGNKKDSTGFLGTSGQTSRTGSASSSAKPTYTTPPARPSSTSSSSRRPLTMDHLPTGSTRDAFLHHAATTPGFKDNLSSQWEQYRETLQSSSSPAADLMMQTVSDPYLALREATGQWQLSPMAVQQGVDVAKTHVRQSCNPKAGRISGVTRSEAAWKIVDGIIRIVIGGTEVTVAMSAPGLPLSIPTAGVGGANIVYGFSDVFEGISVLTGNGSVNPGRDLLFGGDQKKWNAAGTVLDVSGMVLLGGAAGWKQAVDAGVSGASGIFRSVAAQSLKLFASVSVCGAAGSYVEDVVTDVMGENWGRSAGLVTRFGVGGLTYGGLSHLDQSFNLSGVYGVEAIDPTVQSANSNLNFAATPAEHMSDPNRHVPVQILEDAIRTGTQMPDPKGSNATMYYTPMVRNGTSYNLEVLYDTSSNTIYHFKYTSEAIGNLPSTK